MDSQIGDFEENEFFNDKRFLIGEIQRQSDRLSFVTKSGKSEVWDRFVRVYYDNIETDYVKCIYCEDIQKQTQYSGTSGLLKHKCQQMIESQQNSNEESVDPLIYTSFEDIKQFDEISSESSPLECRDFYVSALQSSDPLISLRKNRGKSSVWHRFERIFYDNSETKFVKCKHCDDIHKHSNGYGTGALLKHRCGVFPDHSLTGHDLDYENSIEANPLNDKTLIKDMIANNDQKISFVREMKKSEVWDRFERIFIDDFQTLYVKCKYCDCVQKNTKSGGTQGLRRHRCQSLEGGPALDKIEETDDSITDEMETICNEKDWIKHLTEENNTLKQIVEKCLNIIDDCLCVNKYSSQQRKEVNVLVNKYNKYLIKTKKIGKMFLNDENMETDDKFLDSNKLLNVTTNHSKLGPNVINDYKLYRKQFKRRQHITNSIKNKYQKRHICDWTECGKRFRLERHLSEHRDTAHLNIKNHQCQWPGCEETFLKKSQLNVHILKYHSNARFSCDQCSYKTTYKALLLRHQRIHGEEKCIGCDWPGCDFKTNYEQGLKAHKLTHSGERPFRCTWPSCEWSFRQRHHLKAHILKHTGEKPISCQSTTCDRRFASRQISRKGVSLLTVNNDIVSGNSPD